MGTGACITLKEVYEQLNVIQAEKLGRQTDFNSRYLYLFYMQVTSIYYVMCLYYWLMFHSKIGLFCFQSVSKFNVSGEIALTSGHFLID